MIETNHDFGRYLQSVDERDIDLLLMEEFHVVPAFAVWFAERVGFNADVIFDGAWHSLNDEDGETDLLLRLKIGHERVAVLIENKVSAPAQHEQDIRYHVRGIRSQEAGRFDRFVTCICAPQIYLNALSADTAYEHRVPYEWIRDWFGSQSGTRAEWRRAIMEEAIAQGRRGYTMKVHAGKTRFHHEYWEHLRRHHPSLLMAKPKPKGPKSDWMIMKCANFPKGVKLVHKNDQAAVHLEWERTSAADIEERRTDTWPEGAIAVPCKGSAALALNVRKCDMDLGVGAQLDRIEEALAAARKLAPFAGMMAHPPPS